MQKFGEIMAELRLDRGMTQKELAEQMHLASSSISNYETGQRTPDAEFVCRLSKLFGVTSDYLLGLCEVNVPSERLNQEYCDGTTVGGAVEKMLTLDQQRRKALLSVIDDMCFCSSINKR